MQHFYKVMACAEIQDSALVLTKITNGLKKVANKGQNSSLLDTN